ncbi:MAG: DUF1553 domain-containing protein [Bryobacteraceae bacterium]
MPDPFLERLDCPDLPASQRDRQRDNVQALAMLNNPFVVRMAENFAARVRKERAIRWKLRCN